MKMANHRSLLILCIQVMSTYTAPLQMQYQSQLSVQPSQEELLQQQLFALQQLQNLQHLQQNMQMANDWNNYYPPMVTQNQAQPLMIILPDSQFNALTETNGDLTNNYLTKNNKDKNENKNEDPDSVVIDAETEVVPTPEPEPKKAILLIPNTRRFSIGGIISAIPFLPIEINVPDTVSWIYNGLSSIISGIGNRFPWRPMQTTTPGENNNLRLLLKRLQSNNNAQGPILMMPEVAQVYPMPVAMQF